MILRFDEHLDSLLDGEDGVCSAVSLFLSYSHTVDPVRNVALPWLESLESPYHRSLTVGVVDELCPVSHQSSCRSCVYYP